MSNIGLLVPDILGEIMSRLPSGINQKFAFAQVSRYWRDVALDNHLFWSSFAVKSEMDFNRIPIVLERSGSAMLHVSIYFTSNYPRQAEALGAVVPHLARIETLDVSAGYSIPPSTVEVLLNSNLEFPALQTFRLTGPEFGRFPPVQLTAPQLRTLDIQHPTRGTGPHYLIIFVQLGEHQALQHQGGELTTTFRDLRSMSEGLARRLRRVWQPRRRFLEAFTRPWPLAPALRELELRTHDADLSRILKVGFSDVVLPILTGFLCNSNINVFTEALLLGVGPLVVFELEWDAADRAARRCRAHSASAVLARSTVRGRLHVAALLPALHDLHKTVRELRIAHWNEYAEIFEQYLPQLPDGITFIYIGAAHSYMASSVSTGEEEEDSKYVTKTMLIPGLARLEFSGEYPLILESVLRILPLVEPPAACKVEVCIRNMKLLTTETGIDPFGVFRTAFSGDCWDICTQCIHCDH
ncbi:hypothetical protein B0H14DRAFT_1032415 [Mycena olivaceomarginata]|nr:hypothetical protein B0H14DRAFT_1032415 [Mycena olivaceomarginata]